MQYISIDPKIRLEMGNYPDMPIMMGICSNEGAFIQGMPFIKFMLIIIIRDNFDNSCSCCYIIYRTMVGFGPRGIRTIEEIYFEYIITEYIRALWPSNKINRSN